ncbi:MAG: FAD-dependent oxidoreductase [Patescibacteria group bacterium]|nr:FAD-dependent oxidoreductase [Patescibacteria group bacterium]
MDPQKNKLFVLRNRINEADDIATFKFMPVKGKNLPFIAGQFVNVYFLDNRCGGQGKPYSISSIPSDKFLSITVKKIGKFSGALHDLKIGERVKITEPQGYFCPENQMKNIVFLAGGIGITPFYSVIKDYFSKKADKNLFLFYGNKTKKDAVFLKELSDLAKSWERLKIINAFTREPILPSDKKCVTISMNVKNEFKRIDVKMLKKHLKNLNNKHYFICGSIGFVTDLWKELKENQIKEDYIRVESFY